MCGVGVIVRPGDSNAQLQARPNVEIRVVDLMARSGQSSELWATMRVALAECEVARRPLLDAAGPKAGRSRHRYVYHQHQRPSILCITHFPARQPATDRPERLLQTQHTLLQLIMASFFSSV